MNATERYMCSLQLSCCDRLLKCFWIALKVVLSGLTTKQRECSDVLFVYVWRAWHAVSSD